MLKVFVNTEDKGDYFTVLTRDGDLLFRREDLPDIGFEDLPGSAEILIEQGRYISLRSLSPRPVIELDETESAVRITADPKLLKRNVVDLIPQAPAEVLSTRDSAAFLNYSLGLSLGDDLDLTSLRIPWEAGVNIGGRLGFSSFSYTKTDEDERFVRLFSNVTADDRNTLRRIVVGDFSASSGNLGSGGVFGGLSVSKNFAISPYFARFPDLDLSGVLETPSEVRVYVNDMLIRSERFSPGEFEFRSLPHAIGSGDAVLLIKDAYGREERIELPFYVSTQLLKPGLHEYSYNVGLKRKELGQKSFRYGDPALVAFHRFGFSEAFTGGMRAEADEDMANLGFSATLVPWRLGETNASIAASNENGRHGYGGFFSHSYTGRKFSGGFSARGLSRQYSNLSLSSSRDRPRFEGAVRLGYNQKSFGSVSAGYSVADFRNETDRRTTSIVYSRRLLENASLQIRASRTVSDVKEDEAFAGLLFFLGSGKSGGLTHQWQNGRSTATASLQQNPPLGTGFGYRLLVDQRDDGQGDEYIGGDAAVQYRGDYGIYSADYRRVADRNTFDLGAAGGVTFINRSFYLTRPIPDSFALVKVGDLAGVKVKFSNQEVGRTNERGEVIVPDLISYYPNDLSIEPKDVPVNYEITEISKYVSPPVRGGGMVRFAITKLQGFVGQLYVVEKGEMRAAEYWGLTIRIKDEAKEFTVGKGGEFYVENLRAGRYPAKLFSRDRECKFELTIPESDDAMVDMGEVACEME